MMLVNSGLRVPGLAIGSPIPRFHAIFGMASPAQADNATKTINKRKKNFAADFMQPPGCCEQRSFRGTDLPGKPLQNRYSKPLHVSWEAGNTAWQTGFRSFNREGFLAQSAARYRAACAC